MLSFFASVIATPFGLDGHAATMAACTSCGPQKLSHAQQEPGGSRGLRGRSRPRAITRATRHEGTGDLRYKQRVRRLGARWEHLAIFLALLLPLSLAAQVAQEFSEIHIGAFDADAWNGIVFDSKAYGQRVPFAIRIG